MKAINTYIKEGILDVGNNVKNATQSAEGAHQNLLNDKKIIQQYQQSGLDILKRYNHFSLKHIKSGKEFDEYMVTGKRSYMIAYSILHYIWGCKMKDYAVKLKYRPDNQRFNIVGSNNSDVKLVYICGSSLKPQIIDTIVKVKAVGEGCMVYIKKEINMQKL